MYVNMYSEVLHALQLPVLCAASKLNGITPNHTVSLEYYSTNRTFWMLGALEPKWLITPSGVPSINEVSAYGIIWKIEHNGTKYVAQVNKLVY